MRPENRLFNIPLSNKKCLITQTANNNNNNNDNKVFSLEIYIWRSPAKRLLKIPTQPEKKIVKLFIQNFPYYLFNIQNKTKQKCSSVNFFFSLIIVFSVFYLYIFH